MEHPCLQFAQEPAAALAMDTCHEGTAFGAQGYTPPAPHMVPYAQSCLGKAVILGKQAPPP